MATDKTGTWSLGDSVIWYTPTSGIDATWSLGDSAILDEYEAPAAGLKIPVAMNQYRQRWN